MIEVIGRTPAKCYLHTAYFFYYTLLITAFVTSAKSIFLRFVSKARKQRAVEPPLETLNSTFEIFDRACDDRIDHDYSDDMGVNKPILPLLRVLQLL